MSSAIIEMQIAKQQLEKEIDARVNSFARKYLCKVRIQQSSYQAVVVGDKPDLEVSRITIDVIF